MLWGPFQLISITLVSIMVYQVARVDRADVMAYYDMLYIWGVVSQGYFLIVVVRDLIIFCYHLGSNELVGFWNALWMHLLSLPIDCIIMFSIGVQGYRVLQMEETHMCESDAKCSQFVTLFRANIAAGFIYIFFNVSFKLLMIVFFMCCVGGFEILRCDYEQ